MDEYYWRSDRPCTLCDAMAVERDVVHRGRSGVFGEVCVSVRVYHDTVDGVDGVWDRTLSFVSALGSEEDLIIVNRA